MENIIKQGYLKKSRPTAPGTGSNPANSFLQLFEPTRWFVFGLRIRRPYLEYYEKEQHVFSAQPINSFDLYPCTKVTYTLGRNNRNWTFCLFLQDRVLELTAESREVMLSWCRTLEHTLQNYGALKHVPSEHIYSDYPIKYKPKRSISPPPIDNRGLTTPTPPPSEPAPPIPDVIACGAAVRKPDVSEYCNSEMVASEKQESENDEPDTSEDDFVDEGFFMQKKMEAHTSSTLKLNSRLDNPLALQSRLAFTLPSRNFILPTDSESIPEIPVRPSRNKSKMSESTDHQYSQVVKIKSDHEADSEGVYEKVFDIADHNTLVEQSEETNDGMYETTFDVKDTKPLVKKMKNKKLTVELPKRKSQFEELEKISENRMSQNGLTDNFYSDFVISSQIKEDCCVNTDFKHNKMSSADKVDFENNNKKKENLYNNFDACLNTDADSSTTVNGDNSYVALAFESSNNSPIKPPRRSSKRASKNEDGYANLPVSKSDSKQLEGASCHLQENEAPPIVKSHGVKENIYDFGKCTDPTKNSDIIISKQSIKDDYENVNSPTENKNGSRKSKEVKTHSIPPPLNFDLIHAYKRSSSSSPDTPRRTPTNTCQLSTKAGLLDLPPSPTSPSTPVNDPNISFPSVSVINVSHKRQSTPSPKHHHSRQTSHSPKGRHSDVVTVSTQTDSKLLSHTSDSSNKENSKPSGQERPSSLEMIQMYDVVKAQPVRKNRGESLYSPVMNRNWFGSQPMPGVGSQPMPGVGSQPMPGVGSQPISVVDSQPVSKLAHEPNVDSFQPVIDSSIDTTYKVPKRARSVIQHEPQPTLFSRNLVSNGGSSSPSHDGFQFNVPSKQAVDNEDDDDDEKHEYEDATMRHGEPPLPPRRSKENMPFRSQSVYVPCNISEDPSRVILRQTSLRERQRITSGPGLVTVLPLKQSEIDILLEEQQSHGIIVKISPAACQKIALVDCLNGVWVVGWDCKHYPRLAESIHIGDEVAKINDVRVTSAHMARKVLKTCSTDQVDFVIKRLPYAHVMAIRRHQNGQKLGLQRFGGTAEITYVDPGGLAAEHGLSKHAKCIETEGYCNWWITEINNRPLNLSFKGSEIECKLNAVGKDISIVVHPSDFVKELKKQLRKMRNFKDYLAM